MVTRIVAIRKLQKYLGIDLFQEAENFGITVFKNGKQNKGWKGQVLERLIGLENNNKKAPNGLGYELKSVSFYQKNGQIKPKETMAIGMINPKELVNKSFYESSCWEKLKSLVFCAVLWTEHNQKQAKLINVTSFDFLENSDIIKQIELDYEFIREKLINTGFESLTGKDGKWIQARTKGAGHGSTSRAFYARKELVNLIFKN